MKIKIIVDRNACQSIATCVTTAPDLYNLDQEAKAIIKNVKGNKSSPNKMIYITEGNDRVMQQAVLGAESCPYLAIEVFNDENNQRLYPRNKE